MSVNLTIDVEYKPSFKKKTDSATYHKALNMAVRKTAYEAESRCKKQCPVRTGTLMRGHSVRLGNMEASVVNSVEYAKYVIKGTRYQSANNYPLRVVSSLKSQKYLDKAFRAELRRSGVTN